jgi:hypothetical protein
MKDKLFCAFFALLLFWPKVFSMSDVSDDWEEALDYLIDEEELSSEMCESQIELFEELHSAPININTATVEDLIKIPFLSESQIEDIHAYIYFNGAMLSLGELQLIGSLDYKTRELLRHFIYVGEAAVIRERTRLSEVLKYGRQEIDVKTDIPLYRRDGFRYHSAEELARYPNRSYLGSPLAHSVRYAFKWHEKLRFGLSADSDAGEPFFHRNSKGYDFYSAYLVLNDMGHLNTLAIGNIKAGFGQGLLINSGFSMGKSMSLASLDRGLNTIKPHSSTSEYGFFRGIGCTYDIGKKSSVSVLLSNTPIDATLTSDGEISSFKKDGYHRTELEWSKKHNIRESLFVLNYSYHYDGIRIGATWLKDRLDKDISKSKLAYQQYRPVGDRLSGMSVDYSIGRPKVRFSGECAFSNGDGFATINSLYLKLKEKYDVRLLYRNYSHKFFSLHSSCFAEGDVTGEEGLYLGVRRSWYSMDVDGYVDFFRFPKPRFGAGEASDGFDSGLQLSYKLNANNEFDFSVRYKSKQQDCKKTSGLEYKKTCRIRLRWNHSMGSFYEFKTQADYVRMDFQGQPTELGFALSESFTWKPQDRFSLSLSANAFDTDSYSSAISVYEKGLRYAFNYSSLYGEGLRVSTVAKYSITDMMSITAKIASSRYFDRSEIGSSTQLIDASHKEDIYLQFHYKF